MNIHLPAILGFTRYQGFDPSPVHLVGNSKKASHHFPLNMAIGISLEICIPGVPEVAGDKP